MKAIKITEANSVAIVMSLAEVNGRGTAHTFTTFTEIEQIAAAAEKTLLAYVGSQKAAVGARYKATSGEKVANAYKYTRAGTAITLERRSTGWFLVDAIFVTLYSNTGGDRRLILTAAQDARAVELFRAGYTTLPAVEAVAA